MTQGELRHGFDILLGNRRRAAPCRVRTGRTQPDQIGTQAIDTRRKATLGDARQRVVIQRNARQQDARLFAAFAQRLLLCFPTARRTHGDRCRNPVGGG